MASGKNVSSVPDQLSQSGPDDITEALHSDAMNDTAKPQKPGRLRRTALTLFGVRKSICILPRFFGGRNKNQNKWSSKKGITKSRTHDGISKVSPDDNLGSGYTSTVDFEYHNQRDAAGELNSGCHDECSRPAADQKSLALTRQKKGLRGLFHSLKYHRNHRNVGLGKTEMIAMTPPNCNKDVPVVEDNTSLYVTECLGSEPDVPDFADVIHDISIGNECIDADATALDKRAEQESPKSELNDKMEEMKLVALVSTDYEERSIELCKPHLELKTVSEPPVKPETPGGSTDQLNMIFGDVASLKSFDSLTGCGDIIADQEDDSITESTVSGERSRSKGKRASCFLTYQGGGEEMASPENLDEECLRDFWGKDVPEEMCYSCNQEHSDLTADLTISHNMDLLNSSSTQQATSSGMDTSSMADLLTPQSEHQESVPNSDEGYYDSTTPGPDEGQEKMVGLRTDRLPRDSYSGDALYELFALDECLISPHYENKPKLLGSNRCEYFNESDPNFVPDMNQLQINAELYKVQDFLEGPNTCSKSSESAQNADTWQEIDANKNCNLNIKLNTSGNKNNTEPGIFEVNENMLASTASRKSSDTDCEKRLSSISFGSTSEPDFENFCEPKEQHLQENEPVALPYRSINSQSPDYSNDLDDGQAVSFSQALVDYTKNTQMQSNVQNYLDDLDTNSAFTPNMQALPTIVTFDVVDMHNEGEYDEQIHMELEEDISSPYQEFEESYLQKDAFAEYDYQMLDLYEQNLIGNTWAVASLPRHLGLTNVCQSMPNPLSLDRRSRSLDTESPELKMLDTHKENRAAIISCSHAENNFSPYYKKNVLMSASEVRDSGSIMALWQTRSELALSRPLAEEGLAEKDEGVSQTRVKHNIYPTSSSRDFSNRKSQHQRSNVSDRTSCDLASQNTELCKRQGHLSLQSDSCLPHSTFVYSGMMEELSDDIDDDVFCKAVTDLQSYNQCGTGRQMASRDGTYHSGSPVRADLPVEERAVFSETRTPRDAAAKKQTPQGNL